MVVNAFLRLTAKPGLFERPLTIDAAWDLVNDWLAHPGVRIVQETEEDPRLWSELLRGGGSGGDLTTDAWIAAIALAHGASVLTRLGLRTLPGSALEEPARELNAPRIARRRCRAGRHAFSRVLLMARRSDPRPA